MLIFLNYVIILLMQMVSRIQIISTLRFVPKRQVIKVNMFCLLMCMCYLNLIQSLGLCVRNNKC